MIKFFLCVVTAFFIASIIVGCSSGASSLPPTHAPFVLPTLNPPTTVPPTHTPTAMPTLMLPTRTPLPLAVSTIANVQGATAQSSPTIALPTSTRIPVATVTPAASPAPTVVPGVYVTGLRIDPAPVRGPDLKFYATFLNSMDREQNNRWAVYIFRAENQKGIGETTRTDSAMPMGTAELLSLGYWRLPLGGPCEWLTAKVGLITAENKIVWFTAPNGTVFEKGFTVCPP